MNTGSANLVASNDEFVWLLLNSAAAGFYTVDASGVTTLCNRTMIEMLGFEHESKAIGR